MAKKKIKKEEKSIILEHGFTRNQSRTSDLITTAKAKMTATELKAFYQFTTILQMQDDEFTQYEIGVNDFIKELNLSETNRQFIVKLCKSLLKQTFEIDEEDGDYIGCTIFSKMHYKHKEQKILMKFNDEMKPFLLELKKYTKIEQVKYLKNFDSKYAIRIYAMLKDYRLLSEREINIEELKSILDLGKSYSDFAQINRKVLQPAMEEINAKSDLEITEITPKKKVGKKIVSVLVKFRNKAEKMAVDALNYLKYIYKSNGGNLDIFLGFFYTDEAEATLPNHIYKIIKIQEKNGLFQMIGENAFGSYKEPVLLYQEKKKTVFVNALARGIYKASLYKFKNEKAVKLEFGDFKTEKEKLEIIKKMFKKWMNHWEIYTKHKNELEEIQEEEKTNEKHIQQAEELLSKINYRK